MQKQSSASEPSIFAPVVNWHAIRANAAAVKKAVKAFEKD